MMTLCIKRDFSAAHHLPGYKGACANLHGHTWVVKAYYQGNPDPTTGMVRDFKLLKRELDDMIYVVDHHNLNQITLLSFPKEMPTAENIAKWFLEMLGTSDSNWRCVRIYESPDAYVEVSK